MHIITIRTEISADPRTPEGVNELEARIKDIHQWLCFGDNKSPEALKNVQSFGLVPDTHMMIQTEVSSWYLAKDVIARYKKKKASYEHDNSFIPLKCPHKGTDINVTCGTWKELHKTFMHFTSPCFGYEGQISQVAHIAEQIREDIKLPEGYVWV